MGDFSEVWVVLSEIAECYFVDVVPAHPLLESFEVLAPVDVGVHKVVVAVVWSAGELVEIGKEIRIDGDCLDGKPSDEYACDDWRDVFFLHNNSLFCHGASQDKEERKRGEHVPEANVYLVEHECCKQN